jgi:hypothetical protein
LVPQSAVGLLLGGRILQESFEGRVGDGVIVEGPVVFFDDSFALFLWPSIAVIMQRRQQRGQGPRPGTGS